MFRLTDPKVMIVQDNIEMFGWTLDKYGDKLDKLFNRSMKKWIFFERYPPKWIKFVLMLGPNKWPTELTPLEEDILHLSQKMFVEYGETVYVDRLYDIDPDNPERTYSHEITVEGLKYWAEDFKSEVLEPLIEDYFDRRQHASVLLLDYCEDVGEECNIVDNKKYFQYVTMYLTDTSKTNLSSTKQAFMRLFLQTYNKI